MDVCQIESELHKFEMDLCQFEFEMDVCLLEFEMDEFEMDSCQIEFE